MKQLHKINELEMTNIIYDVVMSKPNDVDTFNIFQYNFENSKLSIDIKHDRNAILRMLMKRYVKHECYEKADIINKMLNN